MSDVTQILAEIEQGNLAAAERLLPMVYDELRRLAGDRMAAEAADHTLQATALVHEAYIRLVDVERTQHWDSRGHFFAAAAQAMRRILVEGARRKKSGKRGGDLVRVPLDEFHPHVGGDANELVLLDDALQQLASEDDLGARLVELRFFAGLDTEQAAQVLGISAATAYRHWSFARAWLHCQMSPAKK